MRFSEPLVRGTLVSRYKRFLADVETSTGLVTAHCPNPGSMLGLAEPGMEAWLLPASGPGRKLAFGLQMIRPTPEGCLVGVNTGLANGLVAEALDARAIPELAGYERRRREVRYGSEGSRVDFLLEGGGRPPCYLEVKSVTLRRDREAAGLAEFPDAVTKRGARHLRELAAMAGAGSRAVLLFVVQRSDCGRLAAAADIDPAYAAALRAARAAGVEILAYGCRLDPEAIELAKPVAVA